jgi:nitrile hydratase accessory protein
MNPREAEPKLTYFSGIDRPVFDAPWQAQAFAMTLALHERGLFTWAEWADYLNRAIADAQAAGDPDRGDTYYAHWLTALERISAAKGLVTAGMLSNRRAAWDEAARSTPHGQPIELRRGPERRVNDETLAAYRATRYRVFTQPAIDLRIGETSAAMAALLARHGVVSAVFVTAFNPFSERLGVEDNAARQERLEAHLARAGFATIDGAGIDPAGRWPAEDSVLALGADRPAADALLTDFEQNAVVFVEADGGAELWLHPRLRGEARET